MTDQIEIRIIDSICHGGLAIYFGQRQYNGEYYEPAELAWVEVKPGETRRPVAIVDKDVANALFQELWAMGFRPSRESHGASAEQFREHIADLRKIAFKSLGIDQ